MDAARKLGAAAIGVSYGYGGKDELEESGAEVIAETVDELYDILLPGVERERGLFITFEGADGCGKSTQMKLLVSYLTERGYEVVVSREPGGCPISERIRDLVLDINCKGMSDECEALLFAASRAEHVREVIVPAVKSGKIMLCDRFLDSSIAYQARGRELGDDFIRLINKPAGIIKPDRTLLFVGSQEKISRRLRANDNLDRIEVEKDSFVRRVYEGYEDIHRAEPDRVHIIDSNGTIEEIFEAVLKDIEDLF
ncbi:MAG: dTMP kinase [Clostridia bacterium]|nr:dTMP kinase [Clostridia bacterium]